MSNAPDVKMGWLDRIVDIQFGGNILVLGWEFDATTQGPVGTVSAPIVFTSLNCAPLGWKNNEGRTLPVDDIIANPGPPTFAKGIRDSYPVYDVTTHTQSFTTGHITDYGLYHAFQAEPNGDTVFFLTDPLDPAHELVPFEIDWTNTRTTSSNPGVTDLCYALPGLGHVWYRDRLEELNNFFPGVHDYEPQLETEFAGHNATTTFDKYDRVQVRNLFIDFDQLATRVKHGLVTITLDFVGAQFNCSAWCSIGKDEPTWPISTNPADPFFQQPNWAPVGLGPPDYTADTFDFKFLSSFGAEGASAHMRFTFTINTAAKTITAVRTNI